MMIEIKDRIPTYPGRVRLIPVPGQVNTYDMVRADEPIEPGTPLNRVLFESIGFDIDAIRKHIDDKLFEISQRTEVGSLSDGSVFGLYENGVLVPFIKVTSNYKGGGRVLAVRKSCAIYDTLMNQNERYFTNCKTDVWLNNGYFSLLDKTTRDVISTTDIVVHVSDGTEYIYRKVFLLSLDEYGYAQSPSIGNALPYFSASKGRRTTTFNGSLAPHFTRNSINGAVGYINENGDSVNTSVTTFAAGIRPAFTLPPDFEVTTGLPSTANVNAIAEVI